MLYHMIAFSAGFVLDLLLGDPHGAPHPVCLIGKLIAWLDSKLNNVDDEAATLRRGRVLVVVVLAAVGAVTSFIVVVSYLISVWLGTAVEAVLTYYILAARSLYDESMKVYRFLEAGDAEAARRAVSMIVGRDTAVLDDIGIAKAAIETVAENTSDGVISPMIYTAIGGPVLGMLYKAVNTMDSMVGYKNEKYLYFGRAAAKTDDAVNYITSRVSAFIMMAACAICGRGFDEKGAWHIYRRDARKHASPNAAQTESVCAGALGIRLAGPASYFGARVEKPYIGDEKRPVEYRDIIKANRLMLASAVICAAGCVAVMAGVFACTMYPQRDLTRSACCRR